MRMYPQERAAHGRRPDGFSTALRRSREIPEGYYLYVFYDIVDHRVMSYYCFKDDSTLILREGSDFRITRPLSPSRLWKMINGAREDFGLAPL